MRTSTLNGTACLVEDNRHIQYDNVRHMLPRKLQRIDTVIGLGNDLITMAFH